MSTLRVFSLLAMLAMLVVGFILPLPVTAQNFNRDIRPILSDRCFKCHGPDAAGNESGLRLDVAQEAYDSSAFVPGDIDASAAIERMLSDDADLKMPPVDSHLNLTDDEIDLLKRWVKNGAKYDRHWAFKPIRKFMMVPHYSMVRDWIQNDIDVYVMRQLDSRKLEPSPEAEKWRWLRRVTYDLTGLPPTVEEIEAFQADEGMDAYEKVVDRLLASDSFGQHMAVSWLDAARYADSYGYQSDQLATNWPYRDWVVNAINENLPYDEFLKWQIAGDMLPDATREQVLATAFNRLHRMTNEGGSVELEWRTEYVADRVNTFGTAMLGLTLECARCHDHKFDPVSQKDYYSLSAFFNNIDEWGMYNDGSRVPTPSLLLPTEQQETDASAIQSKLKEELKDWLDADEAANDAAFEQWLSENSQLDLQLQPVSHWTLDELSDKKEFKNEVADGAMGRSSPANRLVDGFRGKALQLTGDDAAEFPVEGNWLEAWQPYSVSCWLKIPETTGEAVILHRQGGTDVGTYGTSLRLIDGHLRFAIVRFWPGNALAVKTKSPVPTGKWIHVVITNNGLGTASNMKIYVNGQDESVVTRDNLYKDPQHRPANATGFVVGQQFRRVGFKAGLIDEIAVYPVALSGIEIAAVRDGVDQVSTADFSHEELQAHYSMPEMAIRKRIGAIAELLKSNLGVVEISVMNEKPGISVAHVLHRGEYDAPRTRETLVQRATPSALPELSGEQDELNRLSLAEWLTADDHPLTSRVAVNRIWQGFFGVGLIATPNDLGYQSQMPVQSDLLDFLARDFIKSGWDVKALCREIVLSATYRQTSVCDEALRTRDPQNEWLARGPARRLTAEMVRDTALFTSGLLNDTAGGRSVSPYQPTNIWRENNTMTPAYNQSVGVDLYRRSLYTVWKRTTPMPNMMTFDATSREVCVVQRSRTNTPQQAMVLLNDVQFVEAARLLAERALIALADAKDASDTALVQWLFIRLTGREADERELSLLGELLTEQRQRFGQEMDNASKLAEAGQSARNEQLDVVEVAAVTVLAQAIFNSDATIWQR